ncbi:MAG TPA: SGNH hydrolase domain-containing protein [Solirubrobacteraceae bacterium]|jgi:hypothetical protein|nr:SGNH hydrolase domain-containing protein [Solirubrobacteraceae bacterium]
MTIGRAFALALAGLLGGSAATAGAEAPQGAPQALRSVSLRVVGEHLRLRVETVGRWASADVTSGGGRSVCVAFWWGDLPTPRSRICLDGQSGRLTLRAERLAPDGAVTSARTLAAPVARPDERTATAILTPAAIGLRAPVLYWQALSRWTDPATCPGGCSNQVPATGRATVDLRAGRASVAAQFRPRTRADSVDVAGGPLDVRRVAFGQAGTRLTLDLRTQHPWATAELLAPGRGLCLVIEGAGRLCVAAAGGTTVLRHDSGTGAQVIAAAVTRPDSRSVVASFAPRAIGLARGPLRWSLQTSWQDDALCAGGCADRVPDGGAFADAVSVLAQPRCFGAAARDPHRRCRNPSLRTVVLPRPADAPLTGVSPCTEDRGDPRRSTVLRPCAFGVTGDDHRATIALLGDSHAVHWRAALEVVAQARDWRGVSITRAGCPFSTQVPRSPDLGPARCVRLHRETLAWLRAHGEIGTVFVSDWAQPATGPMGGSGAYGGSELAFGAMLDALPRSVRHVYVLRDVPGTTPATPGCVAAARARRRPLAGVCAQPRAAVLTPDPGAAAAARRGPRVRVLDLTRFFCGPRLCFPVVGGAYVYKDDNHMNATFATSLGPFVLRALGRA